LIVRRKRSRFVAIAPAALLAACAGNGIGLDQSGRPLLPDGGNGGPLTADFASIQDHVFTPICTVCHAGGSAPQGLRLDAANSYALLVGVPSTEVPSILRVKPGDPDNSYLIQKLEGHASVGAQMPYGGPPLSADTIAVIRLWILDGAMQSAVAAAAASSTSDGGFAVVAVTPAMQDVLPGAPARIVVAFNQDLDQTRIYPSVVGLEQVMPDGGSAVPLPVTLVVPRGNVRALLIEPAQPLAQGVYRLTVPAPLDADLASLDGERLGGSSLDGSPIVITEFEVAAQP
jgi:methionine-rich copper-binding protein CopC